METVFQKCFNCPWSPLNQLSRFDVLKLCFHWLFYNFYNLCFVTGVFFLHRRAKVKTVTFLLPVDDIYTNRPVLTKHRDEPKITELASITETDSWAEELSPVALLKTRIAQLNRPSLCGLKAGHRLHSRSTSIGLLPSEPADRFYHTWPHKQRTLVTGVLFTRPRWSRPGQRWWDTRPCAAGIGCPDSSLLAWGVVYGLRHTHRWQLLRTIVVIGSGLVSNIALIIYSSLFLLTVLTQICCQELRCLFF